MKFSDYEHFLKEYAVLFDRIGKEVAINYSPRFREFGIDIKDGGSSHIQIEYCPFTGKKLPRSLRTDWFEVMEKLGFEPALLEENLVEPDTPAPPEEFRDHRWWSDRRLNFFSET